MALDRFSNKKEIQETNGVVRGVVWNQEDLDILQLDVKNVTPEERPVVEIHLYTIGNESSYITGGCIDDFEILKDSIHINYGKACQSLGIERGEFEVVVNVYKDLLGSKEEQDLWIKEISEDRRELWIQAFPNSELDIETYVDSFGSGAYAEKSYEMEMDEDGNEVPVLDDDGNPILKAITERPLSDDIAINIGENRIFKIINQKDWLGENDFVVRLYKPLPEDIDVKQKLWTIEQLSDAYIDNISLSGPGFVDSKSRKLLGPNFTIDVTKGTITETDFESWNSLLDANTSTSQQIVDTIFSGSLGQNVNIDYSGFQNFIHFSSATERLANFKYKLGLIEYFDSRIKVLNLATGTDSDALKGNISVNEKRRDDVIGNFDGFERWLYNEPTSSLFTDQSIYSNIDNKDGIYSPEGGFLGAKKYRLESYPKYLSGSKYYLHPTTSSIAENWYNGWYTSASFYDSENDHALSRSIPEHIRLDNNNSEYELFVNMIGHHFDILYSHIDNLTRLYKPEEHPKLGQSKDTLYQVAQSLGWQLENGKQASQLWQYKLGVSSGSGEYASTGSLFSKSDEEITTEVWRRIVNNLPYLLKTKGTTRSIKALMNTYGIPQTFLSIREYGGPKVDEDSPTLIEDRFSYALNFNSGSSIASSQIKFYRDNYTSSMDKWGLPANQNKSLNLSPNAITASYDKRPPDTIEFRFKPGKKHSMTMLSHEGSSVGNVHWSLGLDYTGSYSGSDNYGRVFFKMRTRGGGATNGDSIVYTDYVPLYDGEFWNVRLWTEFPFITASFGNVPNIYFQTQKASDYISDKIVHKSSGSLFPGSGSNSSNADAIVKAWSREDASRWLVLGGSTGSGLMAPQAGAFTGSMQEYREWMEILDQTSFDLHTTNPTSYVSSLSSTSSFDTLVRHYPLGTDLNAVDHSTGAGLFITSSHPNSTLTDFSVPYPDGVNQYATASGFVTPVNVQRGNYVPVEETYYIQGVSLGGNVPRSQKIRLEENELVRRLSPKSTGEKSRFDRAPIDTNRVGLFYSAADQINKEIFNHIGDVALDDFIGDPDHEITFDYPDLSNFSKEYWKKYTDKNDINAYLRIFSQFDYALFNQIKQLLPERVDEAMGLLVEPHALERAKVRLTKRPVITNPQYDATILESVPTASGVIRPLSASINSAPDLSEAVSVYHVGSSGHADTGNYLAHYTGSNSGIPGEDPYTATTYKHIYTLFPYQTNPVEAAALSLPMEITGTLSPLTYSPTGSVILDQRPSNIYKLDVLHYSGSATLGKRARNYAGEVSRSKGLNVASKWNYSRSMAETGYMDDFFQMTENQRYEGCRLVGPGINQPSTINAIDQKPVIEVFETNPNTLVFNSQPNATNPGNLEVR